MFTYGLAAIITQQINLLGLWCREEEVFFFKKKSFAYTIRKQAEKGKLAYSSWQDIQDWTVPSIREI